MAFVGLLVVLVVVAGVVVAVLGVFGVGPLMLGRGGERTSLFGAAGLPMVGLAVVVGAVVLLGLVAVVITGARTARPAHTENGGQEAVAPRRPPPAQARVASTPSPVLGPMVVARGHSGGTHDGDVGGLRPHTVLRMQVEDFDPFATARVEQCVFGPHVECGNAIDVQFGEAGTASFQYLVVDDFIADAGPSCRVELPPCAIVVTGFDGGPTATVRTLFYDDLPPLVRVRAEPSVGVQESATIRVTVEGLPPRARARVVLCAAPFDPPADWCGPPGPTAAIRAGSDGTATTDLALRAGPVGRGEAACGRGSNCAVSVISDTAFLRASPAAVTFATPPGVDYTQGRLVVGLAIALALIALGAWLIRRTDWSPIGEEAAPEIDEAKYADLDAIVAALPPERDLDELVDATR